MNSLPGEALCQIGLVVRDIEQAAANYAKLFGVKKPPIVLTDPEEKARTTYRGASTKARARLAFFHLGPIQLELIEPDEHQSIWREFLDERGEGVHHLAFAVKGMAEAADLLARHGMTLAQQGEYTGGRYAYFDGLEQLGVALELLEND